MAPAIEKLGDVSSVSLSTSIRCFSALLSFFFFLNRIIGGFQGLSYDALVLESPPLDAPYYLIIVPSLPVLTNTLDLL